MAIEVRGVCTLLLVFDMPTALRFYRDVLGFEIVDTSDPGAGDRVDWCYLRLDSAEVMLNAAYEEPERPPAPEQSRVAAHADTCLYFGCPDVDGAYRYLRAKGIDVQEPTIAHYGMKQLYVSDPDGYLLCFQWRSRGSRAMKVHHLTPILNVSDIQQSFDWFEKLGWQKAWDWGTPPTFGGVCCDDSRDLSLRRRARRSRPHRFADDVRSWFGRGRARRACGCRCGSTTSTPCIGAASSKASRSRGRRPNMAWGTREMHVRHPDGHVFRVSQGLEREE